MEPFEIDERVAHAETLPSRVYRDESVHRALCDRVLARAWQPVAEAAAAGAPGTAVPFTLLPGSLDEPLLLTRDEDGRLRCLSNVCTHRGNVIVERAESCRGLRCGYHGRRFGLDGRLRGMPEFEGVEGFPSPADDLPRLPLEGWGPLRFTGLDPTPGFEAWIAPVRERAGWLEAAAWPVAPQAAREYVVEANWMLYCDNYLEGFHVPYVHEGLNAGLDYDAYRTEPLEWGSLQTGVARDGEPAIELPAGHPDAGLQVAAWYFFLFPNVMLNFYPWGLSVNVAEPLGVARTRVRYLTFVARPELAGRGAGADLHAVELEDHAVVEGCQRGVRSRLYRRGRYSARREGGVHRFHRLIAEALAAERGAR